MRRYNKEESLESLQSSMLSTAAADAAAAAAASDDVKAAALEQQQQQLLGDKVGRPENTSCVRLTERHVCTRCIFGMRRRHIR